MTVQALDIAHRLAAKGFDREQAEALGAEIVQSLEANSDGSATKSDIALVRADVERTRMATEAEIALVRSDMERMKAELLPDARQRNTVVTLVGGLLAIFLALDKLILT